MVSILVFGIGNSLLSDDGIGVHVVEALKRDIPLGEQHEIAFRDGGTLGLSLLPEVENTRAVIVIDAADIGAAPGTVRTFEGASMDAQLRGKKRTAHEVAIADLMSAARFAGYLPEKRALIAVQPGSTDWGLTPSAPVSDAIPDACDAVRRLIAQWRRDFAPPNYAFSCQRRPHA